MPSQHLQRHDKQQGIERKERFLHRDARSPIDDRRHTYDAACGDLVGQQEQVKAHGAQYHSKSDDTIVAQLAQKLTIISSWMHKMLYLQMDFQINVYYWSFASFQLAVSKRVDK